MEDNYNANYSFGRYKMMTRYMQGGSHVGDYSSPCCLFCYVSVSSYSLKVKWLNNDYFLDKSNVIVMNIYHSSTCLL